jgi:hypothetical protein
MQTAARRSGGIGKSGRSGVRSVLDGLDVFHYRLESSSEHGCGQLDYALAIPDGVSTPSLISFCCSSINSVGLFTRAIACIAAVKFLTFFVAIS